MAPAAQTANRGLRGWLGLRDRHAAFALLDQSRAFTDALAQIGQLGTADGAFAFDFNLVNARGMVGENALHAFAVADASDGEGGIQPVPAAANHDAGKNLDALFVAFDHFGVDTHGVADPEVGGAFAILLCFNFV